MDKILYNGKIYTANTDNDFVEAIAIEGDTIEKIGSSKEILKYRSKKTDLIDLEGKLVVPGFIDSHLHYLKYCKNKANVDLRGVKSIDEIILRMKNYIVKNKISENEWVIGVNWNQDFFNDSEVKRFPNRLDLDEISKKHNIVIIRTCYHIFCVNTKTLETANINEKTEQPSDGEFLKDNNGFPNGIFCEGAINLIQKAKKPMDKDKIIEIFKLGAKDLSKHGITSIHTDDFGEDIYSVYDVIEAYKSLTENNELNFRVYKQSRLASYNDLADFIERGYLTGKGNNKFKIGPLKIMLDGSLGARTAALNDYYKDDNTTKGILAYDNKTLKDIVNYAHKSKMQIAMHAIGDRAIDQGLMCLEESISFDNNKDLRHGIVHFQITTKKSIERMKNLKGVVYAQPVFTDYDWDMAPYRISSRLEKTSYNWRTIYDQGINICFSSDAPVESFNVLEGIYHAVTMKDKMGNPEGSWKPDQRLNMCQAIKGFTINGARASFEEKIKGSIETGKLADIVVLSKDIFSCDHKDILDTNVVMTIFNGDIVYSIGGI